MTLFTTEVVPQLDGLISDTMSGAEPCENLPFVGAVSNVDGNTHTDLSGQFGFGNAQITHGEGWADPASLVIEGNVALSVFPGQVQEWLTPNDTTLLFTHAPLHPANE